MAKAPSDEPARFLKKQFIKGKSQNHTGVFHMATGRAGSSSSRIRVLVIADAASKTVETLKAIEEAQIVGIASEASDALAQAEEPDVILVDGVEGRAETIALTRDLVSRLPASPIVIITPQGEVDYARQAMLAGARGFVTAPFSDVELMSTLRQIHELELQRRAHLALRPAPSEVPTRGQILVVFGPKGGVGRTVIAANLAVALRKVTEKRVVLVDGNMWFGDIGLVLNVRSSYSILDLLPHADELDAELINGVLAPHSSDIKVLLAPCQIVAKEVVQPEPVKKVLAKLQQMFDYIVVDVQRLLDECTLAMLDVADKVLLVTEPQISSLRNAKLFIEVAESLEYPPGKLNLILNRYGGKGGIKLSDIEEIFKSQILAKITDDTALVVYSINRGVPFVISHPKSAVAQSIFQMARTLSKAAE